MTRYWLMKSEPNECSIDDAMAAPKRTVPWTGVRNYQARNFMRDDMQVGDGVLFYHSSCPAPGIAGIARVASGVRPDPTQFDPKSDYYDAGATREEPRWDLVEVGFVEKFEDVIPLETLKADAALKVGLVDEVAARGDLVETAERHARTLSVGPTRAYGEMRRLLLSAATEPLETQLELEAQALSRVADTKDAKEGLTAFAQKRRAEFIGE